MAKTNWHAMEKATRTIKKNHKNIIKGGALLKDFPPEGYMADWKQLPVKNEDGTDKVNELGKVIKEKQRVFVLIKDATSATLRRFIKTLDGCYYLVTSENDRNRILNKKIEIEDELNKRTDGLL